MIDAQAKHYLHSVMRFLQLGLSAAEIHHRISELKREHFTSDGCVRI